MNRRLVSLAAGEVALTVDGVTAVLLPAEAADLLVVAARRTPGTHIYITALGDDSIHLVKLVVTNVGSAYLTLTTMDEWHGGPTVSAPSAPPNSKPLASRSSTHALSADGRWPGDHRDTGSGLWQGLARRPHGR